MFSKVLILSNGAEIEVRSILDHPYEDKKIVFSFDEFLHGSDTMLASGWHQLSEKLLVVVSDCFLSGRWRKIYQVVCEGSYSEDEHRILINNIFGW